MNRSRAAVADRVAVLEHFAAKGEITAQRHLLDQPESPEGAGPWCDLADAIVAALDERPLAPALRLKGAP